MNNLIEKARYTKKYFDLALNEAKSILDLNEIKVKFFSKSGLIAELFIAFKHLSLDEKKNCGPELQIIKKTCEEAYTFVQNKFLDMVNKKQQQGTYFDVTLEQPGKKNGGLHPYTRFIKEIQTIFISMGYQVCDGPELESEFYNFTALNIPHDHPARDMYDTFWTNIPGYLLRTHTSPVEIRTMQNQQLPIAMICPGRNYRHEAVDASHDFMFMQCEGMLIDKNVTIGHLFATAQTFLKALFDKKELDIRVRPGFFPFVEPGFEIDMRCVFCKNGCSVCKKSTWIEVFPGGLMHPNVLRAGNIDPEKYSGFAFGFGLTRLAMLRYGIDDIRLLHSGNSRFLEQF